MTNNISKFYLFKLPVDASKHVLRIMKIGALITFSLISNSTKSVVRSLGLTPTSTEFNIDRSVSIRFQFNRQALKLLTLHAGPLDWNYGMPLIRFDRPLLAHLEHEEVDPDWRTIHLDLRGWIKHMLYILNVPKLHCIKFSTYPIQFDYQSIQTALDGLHKGLLEIFILCNQEVPSVIISNFPPMESLVFGRKPDQSVQTLLCQNFKTLILMYDIYDQLKMKIEDLLVANCQFLFFQVQRYKPNSERIVNRFLKSWIKGSNPRLKYFHVYISFHPARRDMYQPNVILKGTNYTVAPEERELTLERHRPDDVEAKMVVVQGGYDIRRKKDGTTATIRINIRRFDGNVCMYVWP